MSVRQSLVLSWASVCAMRTRATSSLIAVLGFAGVSAMLIVLLAGRQGLRAIYVLAGQDDVAIVTGGPAGNASYESGSVIVPQVAIEIERMPGIAHTAEGALISRELVEMAIRLPSPAPGRVGTTVTGRGVTPFAFEVRPRLRIVAGRRFGSGKYEAIVGRALANQYGIHIGSEVRARRATLEVVGLFENGGGVAEMEVWCDKAVMQTAFFGHASSPGSAPQPEQTSVLWVRLTGPGGLAELRHAIASSPLQMMRTFKVQVRSQREFLRAQSNGLVERAMKAAIAVGLVMGLGALFGAINTMYAAVAHRSREIATLRALGFESPPVAISVVSEALLLSLAGGLVGAALALLAIHDLDFTIYNNGAETNLAVQFLPTAGTALIALGYVLLLGMASSILPCLRALRCPIPVGLFAR